MRKTLLSLLFLLLLVVPAIGHRLHGSSVPAVLSGLAATVFLVLLDIATRFRDARPEIKESSPVRRVQPGALAPLESEVGTVVGRHQSGNHANRSSSVPVGT